MILCPVCRSSVEKLKTNSHIIPRWMLASIKDNGRFVSISEDKLKERDQSDPKADIVCEPCENLFRDCDTFSAQFFRDKNFFIEEVKAQRGNQTLFYERFKKASKSDLIRFAASLFLRGHLYKKQTACEGTLGPYFEKLAEQFKSGMVSSRDFPTVMFFYSNYEKVHTLPQKSRFDGINCQEAIIFWIQNIHVYGSADSARLFGRNSKA